MSEIIYFKEPKTVDDTFAERDESTFDWLNRSTLDRASEIRRFFNENLNQLPGDLGLQIFTDLKENWLNAFFELVVARLIQLIDGKLFYEMPNQDGKRPDFRALFGDKKVIVEATAPEFDQDISLEEKYNAQVIRIIEERIPDNWCVLIDTIPKFGLSESKSKLKVVMNDISSKLPDSENDQFHEVNRELPQGHLKLFFYPRKGIYKPIVGGPVYSTWSDSKNRIKKAIKRKRKQVRGSKDPALLAVLASGIVSDFDDFDQVIFGHNTAYYGINRKINKVKFNANGVFAKGRGEPTYAGLLAFVKLTPFGCKGPILYIHPRFKNELPTEFEQLEQRLLSKNGIIVKQATDIYLIEKMNWVTLDP